MWQKLNFPALLFLITLFLLTLPQIIRAQDAESDTALSGWSAYPVVFYTDQTSLALGGHGVHFFREPGDKYSSTINADLIYTLKKQLILGGDCEIYQPTYRINAGIWYQKFPDTFYGIGNDSKSEDAESYTLENVQIYARLPYGISENFFTGVMIEAQYQNFLELAPGGIWEEESLLGMDSPYWVTGTGILAEWDSRDHVYYPRNGMFLRVWSIFYLPALGSDFKYTHYLADLRKYLPLTETTVIAFQGLVSGVTGQVPAASYQALGSTTFRGFSARYRDKTLLTLQSEVRIQFWSRFGVVFFAGIGQVAPEVAKIRSDAFKIGAGFGVRFQAIPETGLNIRLDFGFGSDNNSSLTFYPGEAF